MDDRKATLLRRWAAHRRVEHDPGASAHERRAHKAHRERAEKALRALGITDPAAALRRKAGLFDRLGAAARKDKHEGGPFSSAIAAASAMLGLDTPEGVNAALGHLAGHAVDPNGSTITAVQDLLWAQNCGATAVRLEDPTTGYSTLAITGPPAAITRLAEHPSLLAGVLSRLPK